MNKNIKQDYLKKINELKKHNKFYYENSSPVISDSEYDTFLDKYHKYVFEQNNECYLTERHVDIAPILIDFGNSI